MALVMKRVLRINETKLYSMSIIYQSQFGKKRRRLRSRRDEFKNING